MLCIEALDGLQRRPARRATFVFLPIKVSGATGDPGRAVALLRPEEA